MLRLGDCLQVLKEYPDNHFDLIVTDPPYGISFMGKDWDKALPDKEVWKQCYRVLKEGKLAFIMCSPRQDVLSRMIIALEDAGFRTNYTSIYWTYASGFPKAANVSKLLDKRNGRNPDYPEFRAYIRSKLVNGKTQGELTKRLGNYMIGHYFGDSQPTLPTPSNYKIMKEYLELDNRFDELIERTEAEREIIGKRNNGVSNPNCNTICLSPKSKREIDITKPATEQAKKMEGAYVGFQPKPAVEVILVVSKGKTLTWLDDCRIPYSSDNDFKENWRKDKGSSTAFFGNADGKNIQTNSKGRFPANLTVEDNILDDFSRYFDLDKWYKQTIRNDIGTPKQYENVSDTFPFLIVPKASKSERNKGCEDLPERTSQEYGSVNKNREGRIQGYQNKSNNNHPTVKPLKLLSYLVILGSRENDLVLDPFLGSGTSYLAATNLNRQCVGIEINPEYLQIAKARVKPFLEQTKLV